MTETIIGALDSASGTSSGISTPKQASPLVSDNQISLKSKPSEPISKFGKKFGTGDDAKHGIVFEIIMWCFICAMVLSVGVYFYTIFDKTCGDVLESFKSIWAIFTPIITLGLGYLFGKGSHGS